MFLMQLRLSAALLLAATASPRHAARPEPSRVATDPPAVVSARRTFDAVEAARRGGRLIRWHRTIHCTPDGLGQEVTLFRERNGRIRLLIFDTGSDDHARHTSYYYSATGSLRFAFESRASVNGTREEERVYYGVGAHTARRLVHRVEGAGYPFSGVNPVTDPSKWRRALCDGTW